MEANARKATLVDAWRLWRNMRPNDHEEAAAVTWVPVLLGLLWGVLFTEVLALYSGAELLALYGVRGEVGDIGYIWMLSTRSVVLHKRAVMVACASYVDLCASRYRVLYNAVYAKNDTALRFVQRLGFHVGEPFAARGEVFYPIVRFSCAE